MASRHSELCDGLVTIINAASPYTVGAVTSVRVNRWKSLSRENLDSLIVWVVPGEETRSGFLTRGGTHTRTLEAIVHIAAPIDPTVVTGVDGYMELADEIKGAIVANGWVVSLMQLQEIVHTDPGGADDAAETQHTFETAITLSYLEAI